MPVINDNETSANLFRKLSIAIKNIRYLLKLIGTTDISTLGDGTVTDAITSCYQEVTDGKTLLVEALTDKNSIPDDDSFQKLADAINGISKYKSWTCVISLSFFFYTYNYANGIHQTVDDYYKGTVTIKSVNGECTFSHTFGTYYPKANNDTSWNCKASLSAIKLESFTWDD